MQAEQTKLNIFSPFSPAKGSFCYHTVFLHPAPNCLSIIWSIWWNSTEGRTLNPKKLQETRGGMSSFLINPTEADNASKCFHALTLQLRFDLLKEIPRVWLAEGLGDSSRFPAAWSKRETVTSLQHNRWNNTVRMENTPSKMNLHRPIVSFSLKACIQFRSIKEHLSQRVFSRKIMNTHLYLPSSPKWDKASHFPLQSSLHPVILRTFPNHFRN